MAKGDATLNQIRVADIIKEQVLKGEKISVSKAMKEVGYSPNYSNKPNRLTGSDAFRKLMLEVFPEDVVLDKHAELLGAKRLTKAPFPYKMTDPEIKKLLEGEGFTFIGIKRFMTNCVAFFSVPDTITQEKALDKVYKLRGEYAPEKVEVFDPYDELDDDEIDRRLGEIKKRRVTVARGGRGKASGDKKGTAKK